MDSLIEHIPLFDDLDKKTLKIVKPLFETCACHKGTIFEQGDPAIHLYFVLTGSVDILYKPYDAPPIIITEVKTGGVFGWSAIAGNTAYTSGASCKNEAQTMRIQGGDLRDLCVEHPKTGEILLDRLSASVSARWSNARLQVRDILTQGILIHLETSKGT